MLYVGLNHALTGEGFQEVRAWAIRNRGVTVSSIEFRAAVLAFGTSLEHFNKLWFDLLDRVLRAANPAETPIQQPTRPAQAWNDAAKRQAEVRRVGDGSPAPAQRFWNRL